MFRIGRFAINRLTEGIVVDGRPRFSFFVESDRPQCSVKKATLSVNGWEKETQPGLELPYEGPELQPFSHYSAVLTVSDDQGNTDTRELAFETGRAHEAWRAKWISDPAYHFEEKGVSPVPMVFHKKIQYDRTIEKARIYATALGIYELAIDGEKVGNTFFAPGFTSYSHTLQYQVYDITQALKAGEYVRNSADLTCTVAGGWAVGSFVFTRKNRYAADRQALLLEVRITYTDGTEEVIGTGEDWEVSTEGPVRMADLYDGETFDATRRWQDIPYHPACLETLRVSPEISLDRSAPVVAHESLEPLSKQKVGNAWIYDFGQNFAGVVRFTVKGKAGQVITVRHAEILNPDGTLNTAFLRTAKATATYICRDGEQTWMPTLTYMGFRYISVEGAENLGVRGVPLYSDVRQIGGFTCSDERLNRLQQNIQWGARSNFVDIPTDCPQRDERMGWTGDIAVFGATACFNFDMSRFLDKWMKDVRSEQTRGGGIPNTVPVHLYGFPATMPRMAIDWWGDACVLVPWALYQSTGEKRFLEDNYRTMQRYVKACKFWASFGFGKYRYIWHTPATFHFGDWVAPDVPKMQQWQGRSRWTATASLRNTSLLLSRIAGILGKKDDEEKYRAFSDKVAKAYRDVFTDGQGRMKTEFQTGYVLPLQFDMFGDEQETRNAARNLSQLVRAGGDCIGTGFPGTPYILFALCDHGEKEEAFRMLMNEQCPSWLYEVKSGATTIWERWDGLDENGQCPISNDGTDMMISYNHYASGAVGDFLYRRVAGLEMEGEGYKTFRVKPQVGGGLTEARAWTETPYGLAEASWRLEQDRLVVRAKVPVGTTCTMILPDGKQHMLQSGEWERSCPRTKDMK
ncbi:MAG: family 78 glycoside hydrolase catalytic domain [Clostridia bacterium]|nr:family 78 glycoside hydrolase catalytic domain [Clostridia bacterium]